MNGTGDTHAALPLWVEYVAALGLPVLALAASGIAYLQCRLARKARIDELFDRRFELLKDVIAFQRAVPSVSDGLLRAQADIEIRASLLFGRDFAEALSGILNSSIEMAPFDYDPKVIEMFRKAMRD